MNDKIFEKRRSENQSIRRNIDKILRENSGFLQKNFADLGIHNYNYNAQFAMSELGLEKELIDQLTEDYVAQILRSKMQFIELLEDLRISMAISKFPNYREFKDLVHKNLGVARNLRIVDGIKVLERMMDSGDIEYLTLCLEALVSCAVRLKPKCAYDTLNLMDVKSSI